MDSTNYPTRIFIVMSVVIFKFDLQVQANGSIIYVDKEKTWMEAKSFCSSTYDGHLITTGLESIERDLTSCIPTGTSVWTRNFTMVTDWINIEGCFDFKLDDSPFVENFTLERPSVYLCVQKCFARLYDAAAIQGVNCVCGDDDFTDRIDATNCNTKCDDAAYCGGDRGFSVYSKYDGADVDTSEEGLCVTYECDRNLIQANKIKIRSEDCSKTKKFICYDENTDDADEETDNMNWTAAMKHCISENKHFLESDISSLDCPNFIWLKAYWIGVFRSERLLMDIGSLSSLSDPPYRIIQMTTSKDGISTERVPYEETKTLTFICVSDNENITLANGDILCDEVFTSTHGSTTPGGSTGPTYTSNTHMSGITTTSSQKMSEFTSTTQGSSTSSASLQITGNKSTSVVIPVVGATCGFIFVMIIGLLVFFLKRRYKKRLERKSRQGNTSVMYVNDFNGASRSNQNASGGDENDLETGPVYQNCKKWPDINNQACALGNKDAAHELMGSQPNSDSDKRESVVYRVLDKNCVYSIVKKPAKNSEDPEYMETMDDDYDVLHDSSKRRVASAGTDHVYGHVKDLTWNTEADYDVCTSKTNNVEGEYGHVPTGANETDDDLYDHSDRGFKKDLESDYDTMNLQR